MNVNNRLEMFLALNAEAFKQGLGAAGTAVRTMAGSSSAAFTETKTKLQENTVAVKGYNQELSKQGGILSFLHGQIVALAGAVGVSLGVLAGMTKLVSVTREFDKLSAGLKTATGSAEEAENAFAAIQDFATSTPYDLAQVTDSFIKLVNFGLNPSQRAMTSYGNTSSALGKDLNQMIEAVADAATGEFERLKEFGVKAKTEGDKVSFTFRGITTTVGNNAKEIEEYLIKLGETNFGSAMADRMNTLDGALSNLGDEWDKLFLNMSQRGIGDAIATGVRKGISALEELNAMIASGELGGYLDVSAGKWSGWADDVSKSIKSVREYFGIEMDGIEARGEGTVSFLVDAFRNFPENVRAFIGIMTVEIAAGFDRLKAEATAFKDSAKAIFTSSTVDEAIAERDRQLKIIQQAREESIDAILKERDAAVNSSNAQLEAVKKLRAEYEKKREAEKADTTDRTAKYQVKDEKNAEQQQAKDFNVTPKSGSDEGQKPREKKPDQLTPEEFKERQEYWKSLEDERQLTKEEEKQKKEEEAKFRKEEAERQRLENEKLEAEKAEERPTSKTPEPEYTYEPSLLAKERSGQLAREKEELDRQEQAEEQARADARSAEQSDEDEEENSQISVAPDSDRNSQEAEAKEQARAAKEQARAEKAAQAEEKIAQANADRLEAAKRGAEEWAAAEAQAVEKTKSVFQKYADKVRSIQDDIAGREKSLADELDSMDTRGPEESRWRKQAREAKEYEKAAKEAMKVGDLEKALSLSDQAKAAYSGLQGGAGSVSGKLGDQAAFRGVKSSGLLGIEISKAIQAATAKTALTTMPGGDMFGDLSGRIRGQLAAVAGGGQGQSAGKGADQVAKVHELKFAGGSMRGSESDVEALLNLLTQAGMSAA